MDLDVHFYGQLAQIAGRRVCVSILGERITVSELRLRLVSDHPALGEALNARRARAMANDVFVAEDFAVTPAQLVAFMPPVSGG